MTVRYHLTPPFTGTCLPVLPRDGTTTGEYRTRLRSPLFPTRTAGYTPHYGGLLHYTVAQLPDPITCPRRTHNY